jgi:hypothetical protein
VDELVKREGVMNVMSYPPDLIPDIREVRLGSTPSTKVKGVLKVRVRWIHPALKREGHAWVGQPSMS